MTFPDTHAAHLAEWFCVFFPSGMQAPRCFPHVDVLTLSLFDLISHTLFVARPFPICSSYVHSSLSHCCGLNGLDLCSNLFTLFTATPAFSTTLILKPSGPLISFWYFLCSCEFGVAGTKMTDSCRPPPPLQKSHFSFEALHAPFGSPPLFDSI